LAEDSGRVRGGAIASKERKEGCGEQSEQTNFRGQHQYQRPHWMAPAHSSRCMELPPDLISRSGLSKAPK
jgi:hypothetical protein